MTGIKLRYVLIAACLIVSACMGVLIWGTVNLTKTRQEKDYRVEIHRMHAKLSQGETPDLAEFPAVTGYNVVDLSSMTEKEKAAVYAGVDTNAPFILLYLNDDTVVQYFYAEVVPNPTAVFWSIGMCGVVILGAFGLFLVYQYKRVCLPLEKISALPEMMAKGKLNCELHQEKSVFSRMLWGLDLLRKQLVLQKNTRRELERQRYTMVAGLAHDIRTPLAAIGGCIESLADGSQKQLALGKIAQIKELTDQLIRTGTETVENLEVSAEGVYASELFSTAETFLRATFDRYETHFSAKNECPEILVTADQNRVIEVVDNIADNIVKYGDLKKVSLTAYMQEYCMLLKIENSGSLIPRSEIQSVFSNFYRGSNAAGKPGYGMGMYVSKKLLRAMSGDLYAENTSSGVCFTIVLRSV